MAENTVQTSGNCKRSVMFLETGLLSYVDTFDE